MTKKHVSGLPVPSVPSWERQSSGNAQTPRFMGPPWRSRPLAFPKPLGTPGAHG
jgi:hypothetical protein